jgi:hypothetical protein
MQTDVKAKNVTATGASGVGTCRVKALSFKPSLAGSISIRDGGATGSELFKIDTDTESTTYMALPGEGIKFSGDPYLTLTVVASVTFFYG